jgi:phosphate starvation-inducible PhoH-like protein
VVNGDVTQIDLTPKRLSGLVKLPEILKGVPGMQLIQFTAEDVVRHPLVKEILRAYDSWENQQEPH